MSKWINDLHIKPDMMNLIEEKVGRNLKHVSTEEIFLNRTAMAYPLRSRIDNWSLELHIKEPPEGGNKEPEESWLSLDLRAW